MIGNHYVLTAECTLIDAAKTIATLVTGPNEMIRVFDTYVGNDLSHAADQGRIIWDRVTTINAPTYAGDLTVGKPNPLAPNLTAGNFKFKYVSGADHVYSDTPLVNRIWDIPAQWKFEPNIGGGFWIPPGKMVALRSVEAITQVDVQLEINIEVIGA